MGTGEDAGGEQRPTKMGKDQSAYQKLFLGFIPSLCTRPVFAAHERGRFPATGERPGGKVQ